MEWGYNGFIGEGGVDIVWDGWVGIECQKRVLCWHFRAKESCADVTPESQLVAARDEPMVSVSESKILVCQY